MEMFNLRKLESRRNFFPLKRPEPIDSYSGKKAGKSIARAFFVAPDLALEFMDLFFFVANSEIRGTNGCRLAFCEQIHENVAREKSLPFLEEQRNPLSFFIVIPPLQFPLPCTLYSFSAPPRESFKSDSSPGRLSVTYNFIKHKTEKHPFSFGKQAPARSLSVPKHA